MAPKLSIGHLLFGGTFVISMLLGTVMIYRLSENISAVQEIAFIDSSHEDMFELADKFTTTIDINDEHSIRVFLDDVLTQANVNHASFYNGIHRYDSSLGTTHQGINIDQHINEHNDQTFFIAMPLGIEKIRLIVGFDETSITHVIEKIRNQTILFIISYASVWLMVVAMFQVYIKARLNILASMANDIAKGRPLHKRRFALHDLDMLAQAIIKMEQQLRIREDDLRYMVTHDSLTKIANRRHFTQYLNDALRSPHRSSSLALILIDINKFKHVNDTYGHLFGDRLIQFLAISLQRIVGTRGLSARIGGDEFAVVYDYKDDFQLDEFCRFIHKKVSRTVLLNKTSINVSISMGVAGIPPEEQGMSIEQLVHRVDTALYQSKREGISVCYHDDELLNKNYRFKEILHSFQNGHFENKDTGLKVYFQPKYSLLNGEMAGVEALARWFHPTLGYIDARDIIEAAAEVNMLEQLTENIVDIVIEALCFWREQNITMKVAINIPPSALSNVNFGRSLSRKLAAAQLQPSNIELEITEHTVLEQDEAVYKLLHSLKQQGYSIAIDDFGVGYANFRNLRNYPFSTIKIDRDFISEILINPRDRVIVQATTQVAKDLNMTVIAEGLEDAKGIAILRELGCEYAQGYLFSKAVNKEDIVVLSRSEAAAELIRSNL